MMPLFLLSAGCSLRIVILYYFPPRNRARNWHVRDRIFEKQGNGREWPTNCRLPSRASAAASSPVAAGAASLQYRVTLGLAALVTRPRVNLTRYHGVFAPNSTLRARIVPGKPRNNRLCEYPSTGSVLTGCTTPRPSGSP